MGGAVSNLVVERYHFPGGLTLNENQIQAVCSSWNLVQEQGSAAADRVGMTMFKNLFIHAPETFNMYESFRDLEDWETSGPYTHHCKVVVKLIAYLVQNIRDPAILKKNLSYMGKRHCLFSLTEKHFLILGNELINGFKDVLGEAFTAAMESAWRAVYAVLSSMLFAYYKHYQEDYKQYQQRMMRNDNTEMQDEAVDRGSNHSQ